MSEADYLSSIDNYHADRHCEEREKISRGEIKTKKLNDKDKRIAELKAGDCDTESREWQTERSVIQL